MELWSCKTPRLYPISFLGASKWIPSVQKHCEIQFPTHFQLNKSIPGEYVPLYKIVKYTRQKSVLLKKFWCKALKKEREYLSHRLSIPILYSKNSGRLLTIVQLFRRTKMESCF